MIALTQVHGGQNWAGALAVVGGMGCLFTIAYLDALRAARKAERSQRLVDAAAEPDHATCEAQGCDRVLCFCRTGLVCDGAEEPGCGHYEVLCEAHVLDCTACRADARADARSAW